MSIKIDVDKLHGLVEDVRHGRLSRRAFTGTMVALGLTAPFAMQMLSDSGVAAAAEKPIVARRSGWFGRQSGWTTRGSGGGWP